MSVREAIDEAKGHGRLRLSLRSLGSHVISARGRSDGMELHVAQTLTRRFRRSSGRNPGTSERKRELEVLSPSTSNHGSRSTVFSLVSFLSATHSFVMIEKEGSD